MRAMDLRHHAHQDSFALRLRAAREHAGMTPEDLAGAQFRPAWYRPAEVRP